MMEQQTDYEQVKTNSARAWLLAARPKTLTGAAVPVMIGAALAYADSNGGEFFQVIPTILCLLFAFVMQIDANLVNDYFDYRDKTDSRTTRLGPKRACTEGWITPKAMVSGILTTTILACFIGLPLIIYGGFMMVFVGIACVIFCFLYTTKFSHIGLGDVLVLMFFGFVPVCLTYYLALPIALSTITLKTFIASIGCGLAIDALLIVNNYRDRDTDRAVGKITLAVRLGARRTEWLYLATGIMAVALMAVTLWINSHGTGMLTAAPLLVYLLLHLVTYRQMVQIKQGKALNGVLGKTARNILVYGIMSATAILIS